MQYEVLTEILKEYYPTVDDPDSDRVDELIASYRANPAQTRFLGLVEQIEEVIKAPSTYLDTAVNILGFDMDASELRRYMINLLAALAGEEPQLEEAKTSPEKLFSYYATDRLQIPGTNFVTPPTWAIALIGLGSALILSVIYNNFLQGIPIISNLVLAIIIPLAIMGFTAVFAMYFLRNTVVRDNKRRGRELARQERARSRQIQHEARRGRL